MIEEKEGFIFWKMPLDGMFVAIGHVPMTNIFSDKIELDEKGYVVTKNIPSTNIGDGIFVAGDVHDFRYRQAITAAGFGCMAAMEALRYLDKPPPSW
jgi:thioredoxin reductase (NADPH)